MPTLLDKLAEGDLRTLGRSAEVAADVLARPELIDELFDGIAVDDAAVRARAIDALERVAARQPELLQPYKRELLTRVALIEHWTVREHVCQLLPRLGKLTARERRAALRLVRGYLQDKSSIVKACALECLVRLSAAPGFAAQRAQAAILVDHCAARGNTAALRARARRMQRHLAKLARGASA
ncbi:MAG: hypothetical protein HYV95_13620 [Opitutae bacterium]|nr:hypothetical protein [Opitutae bacterium]